MIISGDQFYRTNRETGEWESMTGDIELMPGYDATKIWQTNSFAPEDFNSLTYMGMEIVDGRSLFHLRGHLPGHLVSDPATPTIRVDGEAQLDYMIGVDDGYIYLYYATYEVTESESGERFSSEMKISFSNYNEPIIIRIANIALPSP